jgi:hypothetical protein
MRVSSLSDERVIALLTRYFVPAWLSRDRYQLEPVSQAEKEELLRIDRERGRRGLRGGTVCVFLVAPDGAVLATQPVQQASDPENLARFLERGFWRTWRGFWRTRRRAGAARPDAVPGAGSQPRPE